MQWYYEENGRSFGPVDDAAMMKLIDKEVVSAGTLIWREGYMGWMSAESSELATEIEKVRKARHGNTVEQLEGIPDAVIFLLTIVFVFVAVGSVFAKTVDDSRGSWLIAGLATTASIRGIWVLYKRTTG